MSTAPLQIDVAVLCSVISESSVTCSFVQPLSLAGSAVCSAGKAGSCSSLSFRDELPPGNDADAGASRPLLVDELTNFFSIDIISDEWTTGDLLGASFEYASRSTPRSSIILESLTGSNPYGSPAQLLLFLPFFFGNPGLPTSCSSLAYVHPSSRNL